MPILTAEERLGTKVAGRYRIDAILGSGGMGVLFRAVDETTGERVAVKMLKPEHAANPDRVQRFLRETKIAAAFRHPNVAAVFDSGKDETGAPYLVMELLAGRSLEEELAVRGSISFEEAIAILLPIARALAATHERGIVHRDLKPSNVFLCLSTQGPAVPKLLDFGIAKGETNEFETQTGLLVGSPGYMAPEQARDGESGPYTDIWGVAAVLYRSVMGRAPHAAPSVHEMLAKRIREPAEPFAAHGVRRSTSAVVDRALERDPERRHRTMQAFIDALESAPELGPADSGERTDELVAATSGAPWMTGSVAGAPRTDERVATAEAARNAALVAVTSEAPQNAESIASPSRDARGSRSTRRPFAAVLLAMGIPLFASAVYVARRPQSDAFVARRPQSPANERSFNSEKPGIGALPRAVAAPTPGSNDDRGGSIGAEQSPPPLVPSVRVATAETEPERTRLPVAQGPSGRANTTSPERQGAVSSNSTSSVRRSVNASDSTLPARLGVTATETTPPARHDVRAADTASPSRSAGAPSGTVSAPGVAGPEYERRTGLPLATEW